MPARKSTTTKRQLAAKKKELEEAEEEFVALENEEFQIDEELEKAPPPEKLEQEKEELGRIEAELKKIKAKADVLAAKRARLEESRKQQKENARLQEEVQKLTKATFEVDAVDFYDLVRNTMYVTRRSEDGDKDLQYTVSNSPQNSTGEMMVYWSQERFIVRPTNHDAYALSVPNAMVVRKLTDKHLQQMPKVVNCLDGAPMTADVGPVMESIAGGRRIKTQVNPARLRENSKKIKRMTAVHVRSKTSEARSG
jgi:hypothetical protein